MAKQKISLPSWSPLRQLDEEQLAWVAYIQHRQRPWFLKHIARPLAEQILHRCEDGIGTRGLEHLVEEANKHGKDAAFYIVSNHEGHLGYVKQLIEIYSALARIPVVGIGEQLFKHHPKSLWNFIYESSGFKIPRRENVQLKGKVTGELLAKYQTQILLNGNVQKSATHDILMYPGFKAKLGTGLTKDGTTYSFLDKPFVGPAEAQLISDQFGLGKTIEIVPATEVSEIEPAFGLYGTAEYEKSRNRDMKRYLAYFSQRALPEGTRGQSFLTFSKPIGIGQVISENSKSIARLPENERVSFLAKQLANLSFNAVLESKPLLSTDFAAYAVDHLDKMGLQKFYFTAARKVIDELLAEADELGIPKAQNIAGRDGWYVLKRTLALNEGRYSQDIKQKREPNSSFMIYGLSSSLEITNQHALDMYANRARQTIEHFRHKSR